MNWTASRCRPAEKFRARHPRRRLGAAAARRLTKRARCYPSAEDRERPSGARLSRPTPPAPPTAALLQKLLDRSSPPSSHGAMSSKAESLLSTSTPMTTRAPYSSRMTRTGRLSRATGQARRAADQRRRRRGRTRAAEGREATSTRSRTWLLPRPPPGGARTTERGG